MAAADLSRIVQQDFSGGMFPALAPELIPPNGAADITNGLLSEQDVVYRRGGSSYFASGEPGLVPTLLWSGTLKHRGHQILLATNSQSYRVEPNGALVPIALAAPATPVVPVVFQGVLYLPGGHTWDGETAATISPAKAHYATAANRMVAAEGARIEVSSIPKAEGEALTWTATNYLQLPEGVTVTGMVGWRTSVVVFTTEGIWLISGLAHANIVDENGNVQWSQDRYSADAMLWGATGVAAWKGGLVIPCKDDVWIMELGVSSERSVAFRSISQPVQSTYRAHVAAGRKPGGGIVFNGHYFLPVLGIGGGEAVDLLVCRLEGANAAGKADLAWTHFAGYGANLGALASTVSDLEGPLLGVNATTGRVVRLEYFAPNAASENDANGEPVAFSLTTRSIPTGSLTANTVLKARLSYRMVAPPATLVKLGFGGSAYGPEWGAFNWGEVAWTQNSGDLRDLGESLPVAKADPEAAVPKVWRVNRKVRYARAQITLDGPASQFSLRVLELFVRESGRLI